MPTANPPGVDEELELDFAADDNTFAPSGGRDELDEPIEDELDLGEIDLNFD